MRTESYFYHILGVKSEYRVMFECWRHTVPKLTQDGHTNVEF